jgi:predicted nucleic acid-binding protein
MKKIVINTSPLIVSFKSQLAYLLPQLFTEIIVPAGVWDEMVEAGKTDTASRQLPRSSWILVRSSLVWRSPLPLYCVYFVRLQQLN